MINQESVYLFYKGPNNKNWGLSEPYGLCLNDSIRYCNATAAIDDM